MRDGLDMLVYFRIAETQTDLMQNSLELLFVKNVVSILDSFALLIGYGSLSHQGQNVFSDDGKIIQLKFNLNK